jgi:hypothetical protein
MSGITMHLVLVRFRLQESMVVMAAVAVLASLVLPSIIMYALS